MSDNLTPRLYQLEIVELAKKSNVVAYLDTGAGKTFISVLLLRHRQEAAAAAHATALAAGTPPPPPWKAIFLAPQVALVEQQAAVLARHLSSRVHKLVGADIESWSGDSYISNWRQTLENLDVLVATPQLIVDMLRHAVIPGLWVFDTIVFDEAHHCKGGHPYKRIMEYYTLEPPTASNRYAGLSSLSSSFSLSKPRIFGMSAAPAGAGAAKSHLLPKNLVLLESNMHSQVVTVADRSIVDAVVPQPVLEIEEYQSGDAMIEAIPKLVTLRDGIDRALARLDIAVSLEQIRWNANLQNKFGLAGASDATYCSFDPGAPKFKVCKLKDVFRSVLHVLHQVGAYGAVQSALHAFQWLTKGAPDARQYSYSNTFNFNSNNNNWNRGVGALAAGVGQVEGGEDLEFGATDEDTTAASFITADIEYRLNDLRVKAAVLGVDWSEIKNLGNAAVLSTVDVLKSFLAAFGEVLVDQGVVHALSVLEAAYGNTKADTRNGHASGGMGNHRHSTFDARRPFSTSLGNAPIFIMQRILDLITPQDLEASLDFTSSSLSAPVLNFKAPGAARACYLLRFDFPLVSPKTTKLVEILQRYRPEGTPAGAEGSNSTSLSKNKKISSNYFSWSGIVFAQQRTTVLALSSLLAHLPRVQSWLKSSPFMAQGVALGGCAFLPDEQKAILDSFRSGKSNLLVSTSAAEEGIDVKSCQLVIRFDPAPTAQAFHQSRGRARAAGSQLIALVEHGNAVERASVHTMAAYQHKMREAALQNVADLAQAENRNFDEPDRDDGDGTEILDALFINSRPESNRAYTVESTGAKVDLHSAGSVLQHYISQLPADEYMLLRPAWRLDYLGSDAPGDRDRGSNGGPPSTIINSSGSYQVCATVRLPSSSPVQTATGQLAATKRMAKASAALEACRELHRLGALNDHLLPAGIAVDDAEDEGDDTVAGGGDRGSGNVKRRRAGTVFNSINIASRPPAGLSTPLPHRLPGPLNTLTLYGYGWKQAAATDEIWFPLVMLLPKCIDLSCCSSSSCDTVSGRKAIEWGNAVLLGEFQLDQAQLQLVLQCNDSLKAAKGPWHSLSISISSVAATAASSEIGKSGVSPSNTATYALVPLLYTVQPTTQQPSIDWSMLQRIVWLQDASRSELTVLDIMRLQEINGMNSEDILQDAVLITKYNRMMYEFLNVSTTMKLSSKFSLDNDRTTATNRSGRGVNRSALFDNNVMATFADFYSKRWHQHNLDQTQSLLEAARKGSSNSSKTSNSTTSNLATPEDGEISEQSVLVKEPVYLVPELCTLHPIPLSLWPAVTAAPRLLWNIEGSLHAFELVSKLQASGFPAQLCPPLHFIKQALTAPSAAIDSKEEGNYETLEALGDGLLKFAASTQLFLNNPVWHEGQLSATKDRMVSNKKLIKVALGLRLETRVRLTGWRVKERKKRKNSGDGDDKKTNSDGTVMKEAEEEDIEREEGEVEDQGAAAEEDYDKEEEVPESTKRNGKLLADAMEALIGAFYVGSGFKAGIEFLRHVELADCPLEKLTTIALSNNNGTSGGADTQHQQYVSGLFSASARSSSTKIHSLDIAQVEAALGGYKFKTPALAQEALTHGSVTGQRCYQRLEFLGDCILDVILLKTAYSVYKGNITPAQLHDIRSITLNAERLALATVRKNLHTHIDYHSAALFYQIDEFVAEAEAAVKEVGVSSGRIHGAATHFSNGSRGSTGHQQQKEQRDPSSSEFHSQFDAWDDVMVRYAFGLDRICAPKVLSDIAEALMGAVWVDCQGDWDIAAAVAVNLLSPLPWINEEIVGRGQLRIPPHPVRRIHELAAKAGVVAEFPVVRETNGGGGNHINTMSARVMFGDRCLGQGPPSGATSRAAAARLAAQKVLGSMSENEIVNMFLKKI